MSSTAQTASDARRLRWGARSAAALVVALAVVAVVLVLSGAQNDRPKPTSGEAAPGAYALQRYAERLTAYASVPGYGDVAIDRARRSVTVYWKGRPPADVENAVAAAPPGLHVAIRTSAYSNAELTDAANRLFKQAPASVRHRLAYAEAQGNRSGMVAGVTGTEPVDERALSQVAGVPVTVKYGEQVPALGSATQ